MHTCNAYCSTNSEFERNSEVLQEWFTKRGCDSSSIETETKKIKLLDRKNFLTPKTTQKARLLPMTVTYHRILPNIKQVIRNHWSILKTNKAYEKTCSVEQIIVFRKNKSFKQLNKNIKKWSNKYEGKCTPCKSRIQSLCCLQIQNTDSFCSQQHRRIFTIFHQVNCKSDFFIYLLECEKCHTRMWVRTKQISI